MNYYRIKHWEKHFENNRTKEMKEMRWVPVPNKHDGEGYQRIMQEKDGIVIYGCWHLILQVASKLRVRGTLLRDDGTPISADVLALKTGWRCPSDFQRALDFCSSSQVGWIEILTQEGAAIPHETAAIPHETALNGREEKGKEEKRKKKAADLLLPDDAEVMAELRTLYDWIDIDQEIAKMQGWLLSHPGRKLTKRFAIGWLNRVPKPKPDPYAYLANFTDEQLQGEKPI